MMVMDSVVYKGEDQAMSKFHFVSDFNVCPISGQYNPNCCDCMHHLELEHHSGFLCEKLVRGEDHSSLSSDAVLCKNSVRSKFLSASEKDASCKWIIVDRVTDKVLCDDFANADDPMIGNMLVSDSRYSNEGNQLCVILYVDDVSHK